LEYEVAEVATPLNSEKSIPPLPLKVNEEVVSSAWVGNRKMSEQVFPESEEGMSKLKILEIVDETSPK